MQTLAVVKEQLGAIILPADSKVLRDRARPEHLCEAGYDELYDFHTLFYGAFVAPDQRTVHLVGPPLFNLEAIIQAADITVHDEATGECVPVVRKTYTPLFKMCRLTLELGRKAAAVTVAFDCGELGLFEAVASAAQTDTFAGKRAVFTMFKYEPLSWLRQWLEFNVRYHGADAALIYHNNCPHAEVEEILAVASDVDGLASVAVVHWPFPYGPQGNGSGMWDSNFCQIGMMDHARYCFLENARSVLNGDIDELVITGDHISVFERLEDASSDFLQFGGFAVFGNDPDATPLGLEDRHFSHSCHRRQKMAKLGGGNKKWAVVPSRLKPEQQWLVHTILGARPFRPRLDEVAVRHFWDINVGWKINERNLPENRVPDLPLLEAYMRLGW